MNKIIKVFLLSLSLLLMGCSTKMMVKTTQPPIVQSMSGITNLAVLDFKNDNLNMSSNVENFLNNTRINGQSYFQIIDRRNLNKILEEQKLQLSGLTKTDRSVNFGKIKNVQAIITGEVTNANYQTYNYSHLITKCKKDKNGKEYCYKVKEYCIKLNVNVDTIFKIVSTENSSILYSTNISNNFDNYYCGNNRYKNLPNRLFLLKQLGKNVAKIFVNRLIPHVVKNNVELIEDEDIEYSDEASELLKNSLKYIKNNNNAKAKQLLYEVIDMTNEKSFVPFYNLGVIEESENHLEKALKLYKKANELNKEPNDNISKSLLRINKSIKNKIKLDKELKKRGIK